MTGVMDYSDHSRDMLLERIEELEILNQELLKEKENEINLDYSWIGNLGHWYWNVKTNTVTFNPIKVTTLGYDKSEIPEHVTYQFFTDLLHPDDYPKAMAAMKDHLYGKAAVYEVEYRIRTKTGKYKWYYDRGRITRYDQNGKPLFLAGIVFDITEKKESETELVNKNKILAEMSSIDGLTKISNHRTLIEYLKSEMSEAARLGRPLSAAIFDIDNFKQVNDSRGHVFGDSVLIDVAEIIRKTVRDTDLAGRYGGEEFMVIYSNTGIETAAVAAERVRRAVEDHIFVDDLKITISVGVKQYSGEDLTDYIHHVDMNLYKAKRNGKNQVVF